MTRGSVGREAAIGTTCLDEPSGNMRLMKPVTRSIAVITARSYLREERAHVHTIMHAYTRGHTYIIMLISVALWVAMVYELGWEV